MALVLDGNGTMTVGNGDITGITAGAIESTAIGSGAVLQVANYYNTSSYSASRTVATQIYSGGSFTKLSSTSKLWIQANMSIRYGGGANEGWWTTGYFRFTNGGTNYDTSSFIITSEGSSVMNQPFIINHMYTTIPAGACSISATVQSDASDYATRGFSLTVVEIAV